MSGRSKIAVIVLLLVVGSIGLFFFANSTQKSTQPMESAEVATAEPESAQTEILIEEESLEEEPLGNTTTAEVPAFPSTLTPTVTIDVKAALKERRIGGPDAPVVIREFASLTCGHCRNFHRKTFPQLKELSIDTGKAALIFSDFPLNKPALDASMVARCLPESRYFSFIKLLFETQNDWAYDANYIKFLKQNAQLAGLSGAAFDACLGNEELQNGILDRMKSAQEKHEIKSTPTFVIGKDTVIQGAMPLAVFTKAIADATKTNGNN